MRDYSKKPNRFTFKLLYNNEVVTATDNFGNIRPAERHFDAPFFEPYNLAPFLDKKLSIRNEESVMEYYRYTNIFENSWESVELGEAVSEIFRLILRHGTEQYLYDMQRNEKSILMGQILPTKDAFKKIKNQKDLVATQEYDAYRTEIENWAKTKNNTYTFIVVDKKSPIRNHKGYFYDLKELSNSIDVLQEKAKYGKLSEEEVASLERYEAKLATHYVEKEIFRYNISADDFSYNGRDFTPPIAIIWKDFNIKFQSPREDGKGNLEYRDVSEFSKINDQHTNIKFKIETLKKYIDEVKQTGDNIKVASIEKDVRRLESEMLKLEKICFKGIRTLVKEYLNLNEYENRFLNVREKNSNYFVNSSEKEITMDCVAY
jgi:hypothetical protein